MPRPRVARGVRAYDDENRERDGRRRRDWSRDRGRGSEYRTAAVTKPVDDDSELRAEVQKLRAEKVQAKEEQERLKKHIEDAQRSLREREQPSWNRQPYRYE